MIKKVLSIIIIFKIHMLSRVYGKVIPISSYSVNESQEQNLIANDGSDENLHLTSESEISDLQDLQKVPRELLDNLDINENTQLVEEIHTQDLFSLLKDKKLSRFQGLIKEAGLTATFTNKIGYPITVFAPTNEAFQSFDERKLKERAYLNSIIFSHIVLGEVYSKDLANGELLQSLDGSSLVIQIDPNFTINKHFVIENDTPASNGVLYVVSRMLTAPLDIKEFTSETKLPLWVRQYLPPPPRNKSTDFLTTDTSIKYLIDLLKETGLTITAELIVKAGLDETFSEKGPLTMFAPSNMAFALMEPTIYETFFQNPSLLESLLLNHIINEKLLSSDIEDQEIESIGRAVLKVKNKSNSYPQELLVSGVLIIESDLIGINVVVHVLNAVIFL